mmetsp:Transcript_64496/g.135337  ORF Transcript_64496/g.135337 Transcript_64496/m.135337 type:complete len:433 (-) Transcript_64496:326-1624(-)
MGIISAKPSSSQHGQGSAAGASAAVEPSGHSWSAPSHSHAAREEPAAAAANNKKDAKNVAIRPATSAIAASTAAASAAPPSSIVSLGDYDTPEILPRVAIIGAGYLGTRIAADLLMLGSEVSVYDQTLSVTKDRGQVTLNKKIFEVVLDCEKSNLLSLSGMCPPAESGTIPWKPWPEVAPRQARSCRSVEEACKDADIVIEAVPDKVELKSDIFARALISASPHVILATNTLSIPLGKLQKGVRDQLGVLGLRTQEPRVVGLRFLAPVVFVPLVEVTLTPPQMVGRDRTDLLNILHAWCKAAFQCDVQGAVADSANAKGLALDIRAMKRNYMRIRLDTATAGRRQSAEAKLRKARRLGPQALAALKPEEVFGFSEQVCVVCLQEDSPPTVKSAICGHLALCQDCADLLKKQTRPSCPICRSRFVAEQSWCSI